MDRNSLETNMNFEAKTEVLDYSNNKKMMILFAIIGFSMSLYHLIYVIKPVVSPVENQIIHLLFALILIFLWDFVTQKNKISKVINVVFLLASIFPLIYIYINFEHLVNKTGLINNTIILVGTLLLVVILEATRRTFGIALPILIVISLIYLRYGDMFPGFFHHAGMEWPRLITSITTNFEGVFGTILNVSATFIVLFMIFGGMLEATGAGNFFLKLAMAVGGRMRSGPAQAAVISSGLVGSINGSAVSNVATTGVFTIPLMKNVGYSPRLAGALESVASTGGMILPPVMGVGAFVMAGITGIPYVEIAVAAIIPALLYYASASTTIHLHAVKKNFKKLDKSQLPNLKNTLKEGFHFIIPLIAIIYFLVSGLSVMRAGFNGVITLVLVVFLRELIVNKKNIVTLKFWKIFFDGMVSGAKSVMGVAAACAAMGVISQAFILSGLAFKIIYFIKDLSGGQGLLALILTMLISLFFGMGVPTTASYILVAVIGASALTELGFDLLPVHLFIFYFAILANITPPVSAAVLVASKISNSNYLITGFEAIRIGLPGFILPFLFMYNPELLLQGKLLNSIIVIATSFVGVFCLSVAFEGYLLKHINYFERLLFLLVSGFLLYPGFVSDIIGIVLLIVLILIQIKQKRKLVTVV